MCEKNFDSVWEQLSAADQDEVIKVYNEVDGYGDEDIELDIGETLGAIDSVFNDEICFYTKAELREEFKLQNDEDVASWLNKRNLFIETQNGYFIDFR